MFAMGPGFFGRNASSLSYAATVLADHPYGYWQLNETSGTVATDSSGNGNNGTYIGSPTLNSTGLVTGGGGCPQFNGTSQRIDVGSVAALTSISRNFSVEMWVYPDDLVAAHGLLSNGLPSTGTSGCLYLRNATTGSLEVLQDNTASLFTVASVFAAATRVHLVFSYDASNGWYVHKNGSPFSSGTNAASFAGASVGFTTFGADSNRPKSSTITDYFKGRIAHVAVYTTKLTDAQILNHWNVGH